MTVNQYLSQIESLKGRKVALTGGTSGVGLALFKHLINKGAFVILLSRNIDLAEELKSTFPNVDVIEYDQSNTAKIDKAINELLIKHPDVDTIVLNAGSLADKRIIENGYNGTMMVNYIGARHFIDSISPRLTNHVRFVVQGSIVAGSKVKKSVDLTKKRGTFSTYNLSKAYLESYIYKLYVDNRYPNLEYVITEPGICSTNIIRNFNVITRFLGKYFLKFFFHSPKKASLSLLLGISSKSSNGDYIVPRGLFTLSGFPKIKSLPQNRRRPYLFE